MHHQLSGKTPLADKRSSDPGESKRIEKDIQRTQAG